VFDSLFRIVKEEGVFTLWRGAIPTMGRAMVVNAAQLASYSQAKQFLLDTGQVQLFYLHLQLTKIRTFLSSG
jgi:solute carrier family 25 oxoglutarate transporter 11